MRQVYYCQIYIVGYPLSHEYGVRVSLKSKRNHGVGPVTSKDEIIGKSKGMTMISNREIIAKANDKALELFNLLISEAQAKDSHEQVCR